MASWIDHKRVPCQVLDMGADNIQPSDSLYTECRTGAQLMVAVRNYEGFRKLRLFIRMGLQDQQNLVGIGRIQHEPALISRNLFEIVGSSWNQQTPDMTSRIQIRRARAIRGNEKIHSIKKSTRTHKNIILRNVSYIWALLRNVSYIWAYPSTQKRRGQLHMGLVLSLHPPEFPRTKRASNQSKWNDSTSMKEEHGSRTWMVIKLPVATEACVD